METPVVGMGETAATAATVAGAMVVAAPEGVTVVASKGVAAGEAAAVEASMVAGRGALMDLAGVMALVVKVVEEKEEGRVEARVEAGAELARQADGKANPVDVQAVERAGEATVVGKAKAMEVMATVEVALGPFLARKGAPLEADPQGGEDDSSDDSMASRSRCLAPPG